MLCTNFPTLLALSFSFTLHSCLQYQQSETAFDLVLWVFSLDLPRLCICRNKSRIFSPSHPEPRRKRHFAPLPCQLADILVHCPCTLMSMYEVATAIPLSMSRTLKSRRKPFRALLQPALRENRHQKICICCLVVSRSRYLPVRQWKV